MFRFLYTFLLLLLGYAAFTQTSIVFSQYIETNSGTTPKGVEIFNVSGSDIILSASNFIQVYQGTNGGGCSALAGTKVTCGTLKANEVWVIGTADMVSYANSNGSNLSGTTTFNFAFNGDDALQLYFGASLQDGIGICGSDPGSRWSSGSVSTQNANIKLKDGICDGEPSGFTNPSIRYEYVANGSTLTGFGDAPAACGSISYTVTFNANGGSGSMSPQTESSPTALTLNAFTRSGFNFTGWNTAANGSGTSYTDGATYDFLANITLYAQWEVIPVNTVVEFVSNTYIANEGDGTIELCASITNPSGSVATSVQVALQSGSAVDINSYTTQTLTFPAASSANQCVVINISDDALVEGDEDFVFELINPSGGSSASVGITNETTLTISDNDAPIETTVCYSFSTSTATSATLDANISFIAVRNSGTAQPAVFSNQLRLYQNATKGGSILISALNDVSITDVVINASGTTGPAAYTVDGVFSGDFNSSNTYNITGISAENEVEFYQRDGNSSNRIYVDDFCVTYTVSPCAGTPTTLANNYNETAVDETSATLNWNNGNGENRVVILSEDAAVTATPSNTQAYTGNAVFASGSSFGGRQFAVYDGSASTVSVSNLNPGTVYYYKVFEYNCSGGEQQYLTAGVSEGVFITEPENPDNFEVLCNTTTTAEIQWEAPLTGGFDAYMLVARQDATPGAVNTLNQTDLSSNNDFSAAPSYGATDSRILYIGTATNASITGLSSNVDYTFKVYAYKYLASENYTEWSTGTQTTITTEVENVSSFSATPGDGAANFGWANPSNIACYDEVQIIVSTTAAIPTPDVAYTSNSVFGSGSSAVGGGFAIYTGTDDIASISNVVNGTTYYANIFVRFGNDWSSGVQISFVPSDIEPFLPGDLAIVSVNTQYLSSGGDDELCFVAFKSLNSETPIDFTDNGYERVSAGLWGDTEGTIRLQRTGAPVPAGKTICLQGAGNSNEDFTITNCGVADDANWNITSLNGSTSIDFNGNDQIWILQGGNWTNPSGSHNATYSGVFLYGWTAVGWEASPGYASTMGSTLPEGFNCFYTDLNEISVAEDKVKYTGDLNPRNAREWIIQLNDINNWTGYASNAAYETERNHRSSCFEFPVLAGDLNNQWIGTKSNNWFDCNNWGYLRVPGDTSNVFLSTGAHMPTVDSTFEFASIFNQKAEVRSINISGGGVLTLNSNAVIEIRDSLIANGAGSLITNAASEIKFKSGANSILRSDQIEVNIHNLSAESNAQLSIHSNFTILESLNADLGTSLSIDSTSDVTLNDALNVNGVLNVRNNSGLIQTSTSANASGTGTVNVFRTQNIGNTGADVLNHWSSPVLGNNFGAGGAVNGSRNWRYRGGEDDNSDYVRLYTPITMQPGVGYTSLGNTNSLFTGSINDMFNGFTDLEVDLNPLEDRDSDLDDFEYYLLGNPFPSAISAFEFLDYNYENEDEILGTIYVFNQANSFGAYERDGDNIAINLIGSADPVGSSSGPIAGSNTTIELDGDFKIASGQGFFIIKHDDGDGENKVVFNNAMRSTGNSNFKSSKKRNPISGRFWLYITDETAYKSTLIGLASDATFNNDRKYDAPKIASNNTLDIWTELNGYKYEIQGIPETHKASYRIPVNVNLATPGFFNIQAYTGSETEGEEVILLDTKTNEFIDVRENTEFYSDKKGLIEDRFFLFFRGAGVPSTDNDDDDDDDEDDSTVGINNADANSLHIWNSETAIMIQAGEKAIETLKVMALDGKLLNIKSNIASQNIVNIDAVQQSIYIIQIIYTDGKTDVLQWQH